jgi:hypothetical protein
LANATERSVFRKRLAAIVDLSLLWISKNLVRGGDLFEAICGRRIVEAPVGMPAQSSAKKRILCLLLVRIPADAEHVIVVPRSHNPTL